MNTTAAEDQAVSLAPPRLNIFASSKKKRLLATLLLFALVLIVFHSSSRFEFLNYDDPQYVFTNSHVQAGLTWSDLRWAVTSLEFSNWHPLTWITYCTDYELFKLNPAGYHFMNVVYHALGTVVLFVVLQLGTKHVGRSFFASLLFAVHPLNVESVAWIAERKNVLSAIFWFLAIGAYGWYALAPNWKRYFTTVVCFTLGLMAKPMVITLPFVLLLLDIWPLRRLKSFSRESTEDLTPNPHFTQRTWGALVAEKIPLLLLSVGSGVLTIVAQTTNGGMATLRDYSLSVRVMNAIVAYVLYLYKAFVPWRLAVFYPHPGNSIPYWKFALCAIVLVAVSLAAWRVRLRKPYVLVGWLWYVGTLVPVIGLLQNGDQAMADRYAYIPLVGIFVIVVWEVAALRERYRVGMVATAAVALTVFGVLIATTRHNLQYWHDSVALFSHALEVTQRNDVAETNLGQALSEQGRDAEALPHFIKALQYQPNDSAHHYNYAHCLFFTGKPQQSLEELRMVLRLGAPKPILARTFHNMGAVFVTLGDKKQALSHYQMATRLNPEAFNSYLMVGLLEFENNQLEPARSNLQESVRLGPTDIGYLALGQICEKQGRLAEAKAAYGQAARISPQLDLHQKLNHLQKGLQAYPGSVEPPLAARS